MASKSIFISGQKQTSSSHTKQNVKERLMVNYTTHYTLSVIQYIFFNVFYKHNKIQTKWGGRRSLTPQNFLHNKEIIIHDKYKSERYCTHIVAL